MSDNFKEIEITVLKCVHETKHGVDAYISLHPDTKSAAAYVYTERANAHFGEFGNGEHFDFDIETHVIDPSKFPAAKQKEQAIDITPEEAIKQNAIHLFSQMQNYNISGETTLASVMNGLRCNGVECSVDELFSAAQKLRDCAYRDQLGYDMDELCDAFYCMATGGFELFWKEVVDSEEIHENYYSAEECMGALMSVPDEVFDYWLALEINAQMGIMSEDNDVLQSLIDALDGKQPLDQTLAAAQAKANEKSGENMPRPEKAEPSI